MIRLIFVYLIIGMVTLFGNNICKDVQSNIPVFF